MLNRWAQGCCAAVVLYGERPSTHLGGHEKGDWRLPGSPRRAPYSGVIVSLDQLNRGARYARRSTHRSLCSTRRLGTDQAESAGETAWPFRGALCVEGCKECR